MFSTYHMKSNFSCSRHWEKRKVTHKDRSYCPTYCKVDGKTKYIRFFLQSWTRRNVLTKWSCLRDTRLSVIVRRISEEVNTLLLMRLIYTREDNLQIHLTSSLQTVCSHSYWSLWLLKITLYSTKTDTFTQTWHVTPLVYSACYVVRKKLRVWVEEKLSWVID